MFVQLRSLDCINVGAVRLVDGPDEYEGRVEVYWQGAWGTVCQDTFGIDAASVGCSELGYGPGGTTTIGNVYTLVHQN